MTLVLILAAAVGIVWLAERSVEHLALALTAQCFAAAVLLFAVGDLERAVLLSSFLALAVFGASSVKYNHSGRKLVVADLPLAFAGTAPFFLAQYPLAVASVVTGGLTLILAAIAALYLPGPKVAPWIQVAVFGVALVALVVTYRAGGGAFALQRIVAQRRCFLSSFAASLLDPLSWRPFGGLALSDIASDPLPLTAAIPARSADYPDIIVIQHESIFDPRVYGLPVDPVVEAFLSPKDALYGSLNVDIFGGGSWQSEFSLLTGLSSASFGSDGYFLFKRGAGRFHNSLSHWLSALGYQTTLASSCRRNFLNYDAFYRSIGFGERIFAEDFPPPFDVRRFEATCSDALFLDAAIGAHARRIVGNDAAPRFLYALTNFNHGPHNRRLAAPGRFEQQRAFAAASLPDPHYAEYYARLAETAETWSRLRAELATRFSGRPMLIVHYGDHQPVMTRRIEAKLKLASDAGRQFRTFYAIEALNHGPLRPAAGRGKDLDIAFLGTVTLQQAGVPLDEIFATRASLLDSCGESYFASSSERKRRFHRTLVDLGVIDVAPALTTMKPARF